MRISNLTSPESLTVILHLSSVLILYHSCYQGTSGGEFKLMPAVISKEQSERGRFFFSLVDPVVNQYVPDLDKGKAIYFMFAKAEPKTPGGLVERTGVTALLKSQHYKESPHDYFGNLTSPYETLLCQDSYQSMYSQLLIGLYQNNQVLRVGAVYAYGFIMMISFLQDHWTLLCNDIRTGTLDTRITDPSVREAVLKTLLKPNPELADFIETECSKDSWKGIIIRLWPNTKYIDAVVTGTMSQYISTLDYFSNGLPIFSIRYLCSEGYLGLNLTPMICDPIEVSYTLIPTMAYFELLPVEPRNKDDEVIVTGINPILSTVPITDSLNEEQKQQKGLVDLIDVELGKDYELVVTTYAGLFRYRVGDILRVTGFKNNAPQFNFIGRENVALSIDYEKTKEAELQNAVKNAVNLLEPFGVSLYEYTSYANTSTIPGHYVLYWELRNYGDKSFIPQLVFEECCLTIEESLDNSYLECRVLDKSIGPLEIKIVKTGSFQMLTEYAISRGATVSQYKTPRCLKSASSVDLMDSMVISSYFSSKIPKFEWYNNRD